jgi:carbon storage regulator CsrA
MLVLVRKPGEALRIGEDVLLIVLAIERRRAKLRIQTSKTITAAKKNTPLADGATELTCAAGEGFRIGDDVWVSMAKVNRGHIAIGVEADRSVKVVREELYLRRKQEGA